MGDFTVGKLSDITRRARQCTRVSREKPRINYSDYGVSNLMPSVVLRDNQFACFLRPNTCLRADQFHINLLRDNGFKEKDTYYKGAS